MFKVTVSPGFTSTSEYRDELDVLTSSMSRSRLDGGRLLHPWWACSVASSRQRASLALFCSSCCRCASCHSNSSASWRFWSSSSRACCVSGSSSSPCSSSVGRSLEDDDTSVVLWCPGPWPSCRRRVIHFVTHSSWADSFSPHHIEPLFPVWPTNTAGTLSQSLSLWRSGWTTAGPGPLAVHGRGPPGCRRCRGAPPGRGTSRMLGF